MSDTGNHITIDVRTPEKWVARHFWAWRGQRTFGIVVAFCPTVMCLGVEVLAGYGKGVAIIIGPLWLGFATAAVPPSPMGGEDSPKGETK